MHGVVPFHFLYALMMFDCRVTFHKNSVNACIIIIPVKAREYVFTGVGLYVSVCDHDN